MPNEYISRLQPCCMDCAPKIIRWNKTGGRKNGRKKIKTERNVKIALKSQLYSIE